MRILLVSLGILLCLAGAFGQQNQASASVGRRFDLSRTKHLVQLLRRKRNPDRVVRPKDYEFVNRKKRPIPRQNTGK